MRKRVSFFVVFILMLWVFFVGGQANVEGSELSGDLTDVEGHWAEEDIEDLVELGCISGYPDGSYKPEKSVTRGAFLKILLEVMEVKTGGVSAFDDVEGHWAEEYINAAVEIGLIYPKDYVETDYFDGEGCYYHPDWSLSREDMAVILTRAIGMEQEIIGINSTSFNDNMNITEWKRGYVAKCTDAELLTGYPSGDFGGNNFVTRAQTAVVINRFIQYEKNQNKDELEVTEVFNRIEECMVKISYYDENGVDVVVGSGFNVHESGRVVTNFHVVEALPNIMVTFEDGTEVMVDHIVNYNAAADVAVLGIEGSGYESVVIGNSRNVEVGQTIYTVGYPLGGSITISDGIISGKETVSNGYRRLKITAPITYGNSGGVLVDSHGEVIGITTEGSFYSDSLNMCIPISDVTEIISSQDYNINVQEMNYEGWKFDDLQGVGYIFGTNNIEQLHEYSKEAILISEKQYLAYRLELEHEIKEQTNLCLVELEIYDDYGDLYSSEPVVIDLSRGTHTEITIPFYFNSEFYGEGNYRGEIYLNGELFLSDEFVLKSDRDLDDTSLKNFEIKIFDYEKYEENGKVVYLDEFGYYSYSEIGIHAYGDFDISEYGLEQMLITYIVEDDEGNQDTYYFTVYEGINDYDFSISVWLSITKYGVGDYKIIMFYNDDKLAETEFCVIDHADYEFKNKTVQLMYLDYNTEEYYENIPIYGYVSGISMTFNMGLVPSLSYMNVGFDVRSTNPEREVEKGDFKWFWFDETVSNSEFLVDFDYMFNMSGFDEDYIDGYELFIDVYVNGELFSTVPFTPEVPEINVKIGDGFLYIHDAFNYIHILDDDYSYADREAFRSDIISFHDESYLFFVLNTTSDFRNELGYQVIDDLLIEVVVESSGEVIETEYLLYFVLHESEDCFIGRLGFKMGEEGYKSGEYVLKVYNGDEVVLEEVFEFIRKEK